MKIYTKEYFLEKILRCTENELRKAKIQTAACVKTEIPKKNGTRTIVSLEEGSELQRLQKNLHDNFLCRLPVSPAAKGFRRGSSYVDFLEEHIGSRYFLRLDIENFFDTISVEVFLEFLEEYVEPETIQDDIIILCTKDDKIPQGFITSPAISNLIFRRIDQRILKYCQAYYKERIREVFYSRYADDMLFSSDAFDFQKNKGFKSMIERILRENGFACNESKTIYQREEISLSGYVVGKDVHLSRKKLHTLNEIIYCFDGRAGSFAENVPFFITPGLKITDVLQEINQKNIKKSNGASISFGDAEVLKQYLAGYRSYLIQIARADHRETTYGRQLSGKIRKLETIIDYLSASMGDI